MRTRPIPTTRTKRATTGLALGAMLAGLGVPVAVAAFPAPQTPRPAAKPLATKGTVAVDKHSFFEQKIRPILAAKCQVCHTGEAASGKLDLTTRANMLKGGHAGTAVNLSKPAESLLLKVIHYQGAVKMPPQGRLPQAEIALLTQWIEMGAPWPEKSAGAATPTTDKKHWAFLPVKRPAVPTPKNKAWVRNPIDAFVLEKLEKNGLTPASPASKTALLRRVHYDLIGLPPTPEQVKAFLAEDEAACRVNPLPQNYFSRNVYTTLTVAAHLYGGNRAITFPGWLFRRALAARSHRRRRM